VLLAFVSGVCRGGVGGRMGERELEVRTGWEEVGHCVDGEEGERSGHGDEVL
jgi:hypothetical protein